MKINEEPKKPEKVLARLQKRLTADYAESADKIIRYPLAEGEEMPMAAEGQAKYSTKGDTACFFPSDHS